MTTSARWDEGIFDDSRWDTLVQQVTGDITESPDGTNGEIARVISLQGNITEGGDTVDNAIDIQDVFIGTITEGQDVVYNVINVKYAYRGGWAPQFNYKREWEKDLEVVVEETIELELDPEFIPQPLPLDPAVLRILQTMSAQRMVIDTDDDDLESILMEM
jgi:hypothetical protein